MYSISRQSKTYGVYYVTDSSDGIEEQFTKEELETFQENGIIIYGFDKEVERQEKLKGEIDRLKEKHGEDKVHADFVDKKVEKKEVNLDAKNEVIEKVRVSTDKGIQEKQVTNVTELTNKIRGLLTIAKAKGLLNDEEVRVASMKLQTEFTQKYPHLLTSEADFVAERKKKKALIAKQQMTQMKNMTEGVTNGNDLDYTLYVFTVVGVVMVEDNVVAYNIISNLSDSVMFLTVDLLRKVFQTSNQKIQFTNAIYNDISGYLTTPKGQAIESIYPKIEADFSLRNVNGLTITSLILDDITDAVLGAVCFDGFGVRYNYTIQSIMSYIVKGNLNCNFKIKAGVIVPKHCLPNFEFPKVHMSIPKPEALYSSAFGEKKPYVIVEDTDCAPMITQRVYDFDELTDNAFMKSGEEKYQWACLSLKKVAPYYYTMFQAIKKVPVIGFGTLGVTEDTMIIDYQFISQCSIAELTYIFIHEMNHISMQHSIREGRRNHSLWNIACDLYINSLINKDYECKPGGGVSEITLIDDPSNPEKKKMNITHYDPSEKKGDEKEDYERKTTTGYIKCPTYGIFLENIGETIDLSTDTVEKIYERLLAENPDFEKENDKIVVDSENQQGQGQGQQGQGQQGQGQQGQGQQGSQSLTKDMKSAIQKAIAEIQEGAKEGLEICNHSKASEKANQEIQQGIQTVQEGLKNNDMNQVQKGFEQVNVGVNDMQIAMNQAQIQDISDNIKKELDNIASISNNIDRNGINNSIDTINTGMRIQNKTKVQTGLSNLENSIDRAEVSMKDSGEWSKKNELQDAMDRVKQGINDIKNSISIDNLQEGIRQLKSGAKDALAISNNNEKAMEANAVIQEALSDMQRGYETDDNNLISRGLSKADNGKDMMKKAMESYQEEVRMNTIKNSLKVCVDIVIKNNNEDKLQDVTEKVVSTLLDSDRRAFETAMKEMKKIMGKDANSDVGQVALLNLNRVFEEIIEETEANVN